MPKRSLRSVRRRETQNSGQECPMVRVVARMALTVMNFDLAEIERGYAFEARDIDAQLIGVRSALVVRVDAAHRAEMLLGDARVEAVGRELVLTLRDAKRVRRRGYRDGPAHPAD